MLKTFLEAILLQPFQLFRHIPNWVSGITEASSRQCKFHSREQVKISCGWVRIVWGMLQEYSLLINPRTKPTGVLDHCRERGTNYWVSVFRELSFWPHP